MTATNGKTIAGANVHRRRVAGVHLSIHSTLAPLALEWQQFQAKAIGTLFQSFEWCNTWQETVGRARGSEARIVVGRDVSGEIVFILPFQITRIRGAAILEWHGTPHINYGFGLFSPSFAASAPAWFETNFPAVIEAASPFDAVRLTEMPERIFGQPHPLHRCFTQRAPNQSYQMAASADFDFIHRAKFSGEHRRGSRKRDDRLAREGGLRFDLPAPGEDTRATLDIMFDQAVERLAEAGIHNVFGAPERAFMHALATVSVSGQPVLRPYRLRVGEETVSVMLGGQFAGTFWALISSLAAPGPLRRHSPGDAALRRMIEACCESGLHTIDFASGDTSYKKHWADDILPLYMILQARTWTGLAFVLPYAAAKFAERTAKRHPRTRAAILGFRRVLFGRCCG